jgi:hypothetical protein
VRPPFCGGFQDASGERPDRILSPVNMVFGHPKNAEAARNDAELIQQIACGWKREWPRAPLNWCALAS